MTFVLRTHWLKPSYAKVQVTVEMHSSHMPKRREGESFLFVDSSWDHQVQPHSGGCPASGLVQPQCFMTILWAVLLKLVLMPLEQDFWVLLAGFWLGRSGMRPGTLHVWWAPLDFSLTGAVISWDQDELWLVFQITPSLELSWHLACCWAHQWILGLIPDCLIFFCLFAVNASVTTFGSTKTNIYIWAPTVWARLSTKLYQWIQPRPGAKVFLWEPLGMCWPGPSRWLWWVTSLKDLSLSIHCSFSDASIPPLFSLACQMHWELQDSSTKN